MSGPASTKVFAPLVALVLIAAFTYPVYADKIKQLKVVVIQLDAAKIPNSAAREKAMNDILKQCEKHGYRMRVTLTKPNKGADPKDPNGGSIAPVGSVPDPNAAAELEKKAKETEIKNGGFKVWIGKGVPGGANGGTWMGSPSTVVREQSDPTSIDGDERTWTHEMGHGLGLPHVTDPNGDVGNGDPNNLMYGYRRRSGGSASGSDLSKDQCEKLWKNMEKLNPTTDKTKEQKQEARAVGKQSTAVDTLADSPLVVGTEVARPGQRSRDGRPGGLRTFDSDEMGIGVTGPAGELSFSFEVPQIPPGDYLIDVITNPGEMAIYLLRVSGGAIPTLQNRGLLALLVVLILAGTWTIARRMRRTGMPAACPPAED
jgi:hypothetical protein